MSCWTLPVSTARLVLGGELVVLWSWEPWGLGVGFLLLWRPFW